jgi:hypothetical protein
MTKSKKQKAKSNESCNTFYFTSSPFLKKNFLTSLSARPGKNLLISTVRFPLKVKTSVRFLFSMACKICRAHSSALIISFSFIDDSPCGFASLFKATFLILEVVKPGHTHITFTPVSSSSVRNASKKPFTAYLLAL